MYVLVREPASGVEPGDARWTTDPYKLMLIEHFIERIPNVSITIAKGSPGSKPSTLRVSSKLQIERLPSGEESFALHSLRYAVGAVLSVLRRRPTVLYAFYDGNAIPLFGPVAVCHLLQIPMVLDFRNPPESYLERRKARRILSSLADQLVARLPSLRVAVSESCAEHLRKYYGGGSTIVVPSVAHPAFVAEPEFSTSHEGILTFCYWGSLNKARQLDKILEGFGLVKESSRPGRRLVLIGDGDDRDRLRELGKRISSHDIRIMDAMTQEKLASFLREIDVAVIAVPPTKLQYRMSYPLKLAEALALGKPILGSRIEALRLVETAGIGILCDHSPNGYARGIEAFQPKLVRQFVENLRKLDPKVRTHQASQLFAPLLRNLADPPFRIGVTITD